MSKGFNELNLAEKNIQHKETGTHKNIGENNNQTAHTGHTDANAVPQDMVFPTLLSTLGEHREITFFHLHICDLPVIVYDNEEGLLTYSSVESMEHGGKLTLNHETHKIIKTSTQQPPTFDASVTSLVAFEWLALVLVAFVFIFSARKYKKNENKAPRGLQNMIEAGIIFVRDDIIGSNIPNQEVSKKFLPYFVVLFFFILFMNLSGLLPAGHTATGSLAVTAALSFISLIVINGVQIKDIGLGSYLKHLLGGAPIWLAPIMIPIEILSIFTKPFALTVRLFANMTAGHVVLLSLVGLIFYFRSLVVAPVSVGFSIFMYFLEALVAFLQAYIFVILTAVFTGLGMGHSHDGNEAHEAN